MVNTSPLQYLFRINNLGLLRDLFDTILIAGGVCAELDKGRNQGFQVPDLSSIGWLQVIPTTLEPLPRELEGLGQGETETILLAKQQRAEWVIVDDLEARVVARKLGLQVIGTIGVLAMAKEQGLIPAVKPLIVDLIAVGFWLSTRVQRDILELAGE